ncbi:MAG TPA: VOC family protein [Firmicutes bacterium]|nr:VOC family protein [Bacillota bacterium]
MMLGMTLYIKNSLEAVELYQEALGLTLGEEYVKFPDGTYMHAPMYRNGQFLFAVCESTNEALVRTVKETASQNIMPIASHGLDFDTVEEVEKAFELLSKEGVVIRPLGKLPWDTISTDLVDKFGVCWYLMKE